VRGKVVSARPHELEDEIRQQLGGIGFKL